MLSKTGQPTPHGGAYDDREVLCKQPRIFELYYTLAIKEAGETLVTSQKGRRTVQRTASGDPSICR